MKTLPYKKEDYSAPVYHTFDQFVTGIRARYGNRPALSWFTRQQEEKNLTYQQLTDQVLALRRSLLRKGLPKGAHIAILSENSANWVIAFLAVVSSGYTAVCADTEQSDDRIRDMLRRSDTQMLFLSPTYLPICMPLLNEGATLRHVVVMGGLASDERVESFDALCQFGASLTDHDVLAPQVDPDATAEIVFTSGTTSQSKMVMLSQRGVMHNIREECEYICFYNRLFSALPFYHAYGLNCAVLNALLRGIHLYINGDLKTSMRDMILAKPDSMLTVPLMLEAVHNQLWLNLEKAGKADAFRKALGTARMRKKLHLNCHSKFLDQIREQAMGTLRMVACGGAQLSQEIAEEFELLGIQVLQGYGITECSPLISVTPNYANKIGSVGPVLSSLQLRLEDGEVCVKGPSVMQGYYKDPEQTAQAIQDGWFHTGDLGYTDKDGYLYLNGRKKNLIVFKNGKKVSPEQLETMISAIPMVKEVMVYGTANGSFADDVKLTASIYPDPQRTEGLSSYEILEHLQRQIDAINNSLPIYQQIQLVNIREKEFNKTPTKKIKRHENLSEAQGRE
ncbi:MAG: AMP-dependent synthetase/ligase [Lawsonibacter sp.]|jgi:long-chain acyl-CoA synthetase